MVVAGGIRYLERTGHAAADDVEHVVASVDGDGSALAELLHEVDGEWTKSISK
jgi:hypothetical protein